MNHQVFLITFVLAGVATADLIRSFTNNAQPQNPNPNNVDLLGNKFQPQLPNDGQAGSQPQVPSLKHAEQAGVQPQFPSLSIAGQVGIQPQFPSLKHTGLTGLQSQFPSLKHAGQAGVQSQFPSLGNAGQAGIQPQLPSLNTAGQAGVQPQFSSLKNNGQAGVKPHFPSLNNDGQDGVQHQLPSTDNRSPLGDNMQPSLVQSCGGTADVDLSQVKITGCDPNYSHCRLIRGKSAKMILPFIPARSTTRLQPVVHGLLANIIPIPFAIPESNGCKNSGLLCPLLPGSIQTYVAELPVQQNYPKIRIGVKWQLVDDLNNNMVCITFPAELTDE
ncbi:uncharacterized protein LOC135215593 [Macrobrachium nipponense]|uniref:uncharacterized protein LOC135215593 n=1 Tax=Macrobrachium nipponense TaxID=159736 RepID=UPI0030C8CF1E